MQNTIEKKPGTVVVAAGRVKSGVKKLGAKVRAGVGKIGSRIKRKFGRVGERMIERAIRDAIAGALEEATKAVEGKAKKGKVSKVGKGVKVTIAPVQSFAEKK